MGYKYKQYDFMDDIIDTAAAISERLDDELARAFAEQIHKNNNPTAFCQECGERIPDERLKVIPNACFCVKCQGLAEKDIRLITVNTVGFHNIDRVPESEEKHEE